MVGIFGIREEQSDQTGDYVCVYRGACVSDVKVAEGDG
jgi:hypothetical protein